MDTRQDRIELFGKLADPATTSEFFARVAEDVNWTVEADQTRTRSTSRDFCSAGPSHAGARAVARRTAALPRRPAHGVPPAHPIMRDGVRLELQHQYVDGDTVIAEQQATSTMLDGAPFDDHYCWVCRFRSDQPGERIVEVRAYLDSAMVAWAITLRVRWPRTNCSVLADGTGHPG